jgi:NADH dehydrogenase
LFFLIGFRNRFLVLTEWAWAYITYNHSARLITEPHEAEQLEKPKAKAG